MKNACIVLLCLTTLLLCGCPVGSGYPLEVKENGTVDKSLVGTWVNTDSSAEVISARISMDDDAYYKVEVLEKGENFLIDATVFKGWLTALGDRKFLVLQEIMDGTPAETYYVYDIAIGEDAITTHDISLKVGGASAITSVSAYQNEVKGSMGFSDFLSGPITWKKTE